MLPTTGRSMIFDFRQAASKLQVPFKASQAVQSSPAPSRTVQNCPDLFRIHQNRPEPSRSAPELLPGPRPMLPKALADPTQNPCRASQTRPAQGYTLRFGNPEFLLLKMDNFNIKLYLTKWRFGALQGQMEPVLTIAPGSA